MDIKKLTSDFFELERELGLFSKEIGNIKYWQYVRFLLFMEIRKQVLNYDNAGIGDRKANISVHLRGVFFFLVNSIKYFLQTKKQYEIVIFSHPRRELINNKYVDIYSDIIVDNLQYSTITFEKFFKLSHLRPAKTNELVYLDFIEYPMRFISYFKKYRFSVKELDDLSVLQEQINIRFKVKININEYLNRFLTRYNFIRPQLHSLICKINPKIIIEVIGYSFINQIVNSIAKEKSIPTIELQHGIIGPYHLGYNDPHNKKLESFPNYFFTWGEFWTKNMTFPISTERVVNSGFPYFEQEVEIHKRVSINKDILIISQGTIGRKLAELTYSLASKFEDRTFYFKLHPGEVKNLDAKYDFLQEKTNITVLKKLDVKMYNLFEMTELQIGVASTAIIEGIGFGLRTIIYTLSGSEYFENLEESETLIKTNSIEEITAFINKKVDTKNTINLSNYFFTKNSLGKINGNIDDIIKNRIDE